MLGKKAGSKYLSLWWYFVLAVIVAGILVSVLSNVSSEVNINKQEADLLSNKIADCLVKNGDINKDFINGNLDIFKNCSLSEKAFEQGLYFQITAYDFNSCVNNGNPSCSKILKDVKLGEYSMQKNCNPAKKGIKAEYFPICVERYIYALNETNKVMIYIGAGSNLRGARV